MSTQGLIKCIRSETTLVLLSDYWTNPNGPELFIDVSTHEKKKIDTGGLNNDITAEGN